MALFKQVTIVGLGLMGGSLGMALRRRRLAKTVVGLSRTSSTLRRAKQRGAIDTGTTNAKQAVRDADLVILATPVDTIVPLALRFTNWMRPGSILTDVGSTKATIVNALERRLPRHVAFVGGHPLAGSEQCGIASARADVLNGSMWILTATSRTDRRALRALARLCQSLVKRVIVMDPQRHDQLLAAVSHLPHLVAFCLVEATADGALTVAPRSFLDATRVAKSDPELWDDIFFTNRAALLAAMRRFDQRWRMLRTQLARGDRAALRRVLTRAQVKRNALQDH